jgi:hypothetical protein
LAAFTINIAESNFRHTQAIILFGVVIPPQLGLSMEFAVGIMLVLLGVLTLTGMRRAVGAAHAHVGVPDGHALDLHDHLHCNPGAGTDCRAGERSFLSARPEPAVLPHSGNRQLASQVHC